jgi:hypothetical protein
MGLKTHPYIGDINAKRIRFTTDAQPFSCFVVPVATEHEGLSGKYHLM